MALFNTSKIAGAIAATAVALALSATAAQASIITYAFDYTAGTGSNYETVVKSLVTVNTAIPSGSVTIGAETLIGETIIAMTGTRDIYNTHGSLNQALWTLSTSGVINHIDPYNAINNDNIVYVGPNILLDPTDFTVDQFGPGFNATMHGNSTDDYSVFYDNFPHSFYYGDYVENNSSNNIAGIDTASLTQVPAPAPLALLGAGLFGLGFLRRRKAS